MIMEQNIQYINIYILHWSYNPKTRASCHKLYLDILIGFPYALKTVTFYII